MRASSFAAVVLLTVLVSPSLRAETVGDLLAQMKSTQKDVADLDGRIAANHAKTTANDADEQALVEEFNRDIKPLQDSQEQKYAAQQSAEADERAKATAYKADCPDDGFPEDRQQACDAEYAAYDASYTAYDQATRDYNVASAAFHKLYDPFDVRRNAALKTGSDLAAEAKQLDTDRSSKLLQLHFLEARLQMAKIDQKSRDCLALPTDEAVLNCLSGQWDGTAPSNLWVPDPPKGLTQEQVIERYKNSGKPTGPQTLKTKEPPPPPTSK